MTIATAASTGSVDDLIRSLHEAGTVTADDGAELHLKDFAVSPAHGEILAGAVAAVAPQATVEVGCASALATLYMARGRLAAGCPEPGSAHVIDPKQSSHWHDIGRRVIRRAGLDEIVRFHETPAHEVLPRLAAEELRVRFVFIDGWHMLDFVMVEAFYCDLMLELGGVIALHDMNMPALRLFASFWCANRAYEPVRVEQGRLVTHPPEAPTREAERTAGEPTLYARSLAAWVEGKTLLLRKTGDDRRAWDEFAEFA